MNKKKITASVTTELTTDQRVIRICSTLVKMGFDVTVIGRRFSNSMPLDEYPFNAIRLYCFFKKGFLQYAEFNTKLFFKLLFSKTDYFLSNDLDTLVPNYILSRLKKKMIFYDTHEYYTGVPELADSPFKRAIWKFFEDRIFPRLPIVYTVNESVKNKYRQEYGNTISVVRNVPASVSTTPLPMPENWKDKHVLLMQGTGINPGRGGIELLAAMKYLPDNYQLVYIGSGKLWDIITKKRKEWELESRVDMISKISPIQLKRYTPLASLGFTLDGSENLNFLFNLPNKVFDYIQAHVPVVATDIPEVKSIIEQFQCGICLSSQEPERIAVSVMELMHDKEKYDEMKRNTVKAARELNWENEQQKLVDIFEPYL